MVVYYDLEKEWRCSASGVRLNGNPPVLRYKEKPEWTLCFMRGGYPCTESDFGGALSFRAAVDVDLNTESEVICRTTDESINRTAISSGVLIVPLNANTTGFQAASNNQESRKAFFELWGFDQNSDPVFYVRFEIRISGVVDPEGGVPPESITPDTITRAEVMACLRAPDERQFTSDPSDSSAAHSSQTASDLYTRRRNSAAAGEWGPWEALIQGPEGDMPSISAGSASTLPAGSSPSVEILSSGGGYVMNFGIPAGAGAEAYTSQVSSGAIIYTSDAAHGASSAVIFNGTNGINGSNGSNGSDGISPICSITQTSSGAVIYTSDAQGMRSAVIHNGSNGQDGSVTQIQSYFPFSSYLPNECFTYNGGGYQVVVDSYPGENPDNMPSKFICFASARADVQKINSTGSAVDFIGHEAHKFTVTSGAVISVDSSGLASNVCVTAELWLDMPSPAVSFTLSAFTWVDGAVPDFDSANTRYVLVVRWNGTKFLACSAYEESLS